MRGNGVGSVTASLAVIVGLIAASGAVAEQVEDPTGNACIGVDEAAECERVALASGGDASCEPERIVQPRRCVAVSDRGEARCGGFCLAASGTGDAEGFIALTGTGDGRGGIAVAGTGEARGGSYAASGLGTANATLVALSGTGDAHTEGFGLVAVSGTGNTSAHVAEVNGMNEADGCVAASATGPADASCGLGGEELSVSGCETAQEGADRDEACRDAEQRHEIADRVFCERDLTTREGEGHAWCAIQPGACVDVVWGAALGPVFVGGYNGCQAGVFYDEGGHDHGPQP